MSIVLEGSTSGSVTLQEPAIAGTTVLDLPAVSGTLITTGTTGQVIASGALPIGSVLQVVQGTTSTFTAITSTSYTDTNLSATITPKFSTSKILAIVTQSAYTGINANTMMTAAVQLVRASTSVYIVGYAVGGRAGTSVDGYVLMGGLATFSYLDSPATTSATTYKIQGKTSVATNFATLYCQDGFSSTIQLLEIAA
jgi:hypothetical protein